ncbi:MAG: ion transporter [Saprospiraceae bacterium]
MKKIVDYLFVLIDDENKKDSRLNYWLSLLIMGLIITSIVAVMIDSDAILSEKYKKPLFLFEVFAVAIFSMEYIARLITAHRRYPNKKTWRGAAIKYIFSSMAIIDILAILPFYIEMAQGVLVYFGMKTVIDLRFIRVLRLMRLLRIFKMGRYNDSMKLISRVLKEEKEKLLLTIFITFILLILSSALIYTVEQGGEHAHQFPNMYSSMWWAIATLTTVGYGDVYPVTALGKILAGVIALLGIGLVALPTGILSSAFVDRINENNEEEGTCNCPHCGKEIERKNLK